MVPLLLIGFLRCSLICGVLAGNSLNGIEKRTDGWCEGWITTISACSRAAIKLGLSNPEAAALDGFSESGFALYPPVGWAVIRLVAFATYN